MHSSFPENADDEYGRQETIVLTRLQLMHLRNKDDVGNVNCVINGDDGIRNSNGSLPTGHKRSTATEIRGYGLKASENVDNDLEGSSKSSGVRLVPDNLVGEPMGTGEAKSANPGTNPCDGTNFLFEGTGSLFEGTGGLNSIGSSNVRGVNDSSKKTSSVKSTTAKGASYRDNAGTTKRSAPEPSSRFLSAEFVNSEDDEDKPTPDNGNGTCAATLPPKLLHREPSTTQVKESTMSRTKEPSTTQVKESIISCVGLRASNQGNQREDSSVEVSQQGSLSLKAPVKAPVRMDLRMFAFSPAMYAFRFHALFYPCHAPFYPCHAPFY